ncbi:S1 family peptidase [Bowmanella yangjiangensis]|uniref:Trypsin-like peptidase domain-containing protein n=1 Tax=Bowmanella yangjiangensis TaxID=2811230 RepID=A0ABS3CVZ1_9ALTE|nr:serine protease [Bowmanella yangjiangensis]MBN7821288.1 trypsin-like peptidase domain-containing protein [Bowmanella yangjiangensis]
MKLLCSALFILSLIHSVHATEDETLSRADLRQIRTGSSPLQLNAVGRIIATFKNGKSRGCTASLSDTVPGRASRLLTTNRHCVFNETSGEQAVKLVWKNLLVDGTRLEYPASLVHENSDYDTALLSIPQKIPFSRIKPLLLETELIAHPNEMILFSQKIYAAGYSSDAELGYNGKTLTYSDISTRQRFKEGALNSFLVETFTFEGASGGPLFSISDLSEEDIENPFGQAYLLGTLLGAAKGATDKFVSKNGATGSNYSLYSNYSNFFINNGFTLFERFNAP